ncbi:MULTISPECIES: triphosphoribosyl-dephospho-CoA synthase [Streptomyces]|uniref:triphosphoribosyl-dephospho-CoA synthase n=1 Tax=Streptomyces TaxID=1883 RepID=UPI00136DADE7|nr:triphosphoribosyl-dephospho-CoA synthase [Streptomyces sp. EAS-AB2608]MYU31114.1 hypothetical protein [Streptomyces sp. SID7810]
MPGCCTGRRDARTSTASPTTLSTARGGKPAPNSTRSSSERTGRQRGCGLRSAGRRPRRLPPIRRALIALRTARTAGATETQAPLDALRTVMATLQDTELLYTAGPASLRHVQAGARTVLETGDTAAPAGAETLTALDADLRARSWSPRGSTGLLAGSLFLDALTSGRRALVPGCRTVGLRGCRPAARLEGIPRRDRRTLRHRQARRIRSRIRHVRRPKSSCRKS